MDTQIAEHNIRKKLECIYHCKGSEQYVLVSYNNNGPEFIYTGEAAEVKGKRCFFDYASKLDAGWCLSYQVAIMIAHQLNELHKDLGVNFKPEKALQYFTRNLEIAHDRNIRIQP